MHWSQIVNTLTVGLNRSSMGISTAFDEAEQTVGQDPGQILLRQLAQHSLQRRAALRLQLAPETDELPLAISETKAYLPVAALPWLFRLLRRNHPSLVRRCLEEARDLGWILPPEHIPALFDFALHQKLDPALILTVAGSRGSWLAPQHPDWAVLLPATEVDWEHGTPARRLAWLRHLRQTSPQLGLALLQDTMSQHSPAFLAEATLALQTGLHAGDIPLLEKLRQHRRKEVRLAAIHRLRALPDSPLNIRMQARLQPLLRRKRRLLRENLDVDVPPQLPAEWKQDGVDQPEFDARNMGKKAAWLCQMLASVPPNYWESHLDMKPAQLIQAASHHDWAQPLLHGWMLAALRFKQVGWAQAWLQTMLQEKPRPDLAFELQLPQWVPMSISEELWNILPPSTCEKLALQALQKAEGPDSNLQIFPLLLGSHVDLSDKIAEAFARRLYALLEKFGNHMGYPFRSFLYNLPKLAVLIHPDMHPVLQGIWASNPAYAQWYDNHLQDTLSLIFIRYRWFQAIQ